MIDFGTINELMILLAVAGVVVPVFGRLKFGVVPAFLIAGALLGPGGLGGLVDGAPWLHYVTFAEPERVRPFAELGVIFLLFMVGLEISLRRLWDMRLLVLGLGSAQVLLSAVAIAAIAAGYGNSFGLSVAVGLGLALSSTAIVTQLLIDTRRLAAPTGRAAISVLLFQDLMVVPMVLIIGLLGGEQMQVSGAVAVAIFFGLVAIAGILVAGRFVVGPLLRLAATGGGREAVVAIVVFVIFAMALLTGLVGLSAALGAFLAGLLLSESEFRHQIEVDVEPFKGLLLGLFFMTVGMSFDPGVFATDLAAILVSVVGLLAIKAVIVFGLARLFGLNLAVSAELGLLLAGAGEFGFIVLALAGEAGIVSPDDQRFFVTVTALTMLAIPALAAAGHRIGAMLARRLHEADREISGEIAEYSGHVIIGGFGRVGRTVAAILDAERIPWVALERDADVVAAERKAGRPVYFGDAGRRDMLERVGGPSARAFVVTTDAAAAEERMVRAILSAWPNAVVHARAKDHGHAGQLLASGVTSAVPEAMEASLQLAGRVLAGEGLPDEAIDARLARQRDTETERAGVVQPPAEGSA